MMGKQTHVNKTKIILQTTANIMIFTVTDLLLRYLLLDISKTRISSRYSYLILYYFSIVN